jgi:hypothetical protein
MDFHLGVTMSSLQANTPPPKPSPLKGEGGVGVGRINDAIQRIPYNLL